MIIELRQYTIREGMRSEWVRLMDEVIIPFQEREGMEVVGSFIVPSEESSYIWIRKFSSEESRRELYNRVYGSEYWKGSIRKAMGSMLIKSGTRVTLMEPTPGSAIR